MESTKTVLLLGEKSTQATDLTFLFQLSGIETIQISDDIEAFNLLVQRQSSPQPLSMLLIKDADIQRPILQLLGELERRQAMLPIVLIQRNTLPLEKLSCPEHLKEMIKQCNPDMTHSYLRQAFTSNSEVAVKTS